MIHTPVLNERTRNLGMKPGIAGMILQGVGMKGENTVFGDTVLVQGSSSRVWCTPTSLQRHGLLAGPTSPKSGLEDHP